MTVPWFPWANWSDSNLTFDQNDSCRIRTINVENLSLNIFPANACPWTSIDLWNTKEWIVDQTNCFVLITASRKGSVPRSISLTGEEVFVGFANVLPISDTVIFHHIIYWKRCPLLPADGFVVELSIGCEPGKRTMNSPGRQQVTRKPKQDERLHL